MHVCPSRSLDGLHWENEVYPVLVPGVIYWGCQACRSVFVKLLVKFDLKLEVSDGKNMVKCFGRTFYLPGKHQKFRGEFRSKFRRNFRKLRFKFRDFFGNFVPQKGGANNIGDAPEQLKSRCA